MGVMAELVKIASTTVKTLRGAPGPTVNAVATGLGGVSLEAPIYQGGGVMHRPPLGVRGIFIPLGSGRREGVVICEANYSLSIAVDAGETVLYSTTADGSTLMAEVRIGADGLIRVGNSSQSLKTVLDALIDHLSALTTINCVAGSPVTLNPSVITQLTQDKAALAALLTD